MRILLKLSLFAICIRSQDYNDLFANLNKERSPFGYDSQIFQGSNNHPSMSYRQGIMSQNNQQSSYDHLKSAFDFVIVGAGPSGSVLAVRLANKGYKTLLIEAGPNSANGNITTPAFHINADEEPQVSWEYITKDYPEASGLRQNVFYPRASGIGGCTLHNALIHVYPNKEDFDYLVQITGDKSWSEPNMRKYFEEFTGSKNTIRKSLPIRLLSQLPILGTLGNYFTDAISTITRNKGWLPLTVFQPKNVLNFDSKLIDIAYKILLRPFISGSILGIDLNDKIGDQLVNSQEGSFLIPMNVDPETYQRRGVRELVLETVKQNKNLVVWTDTLVTKIILTPDNSRALGVEYKKGKHFYRASPLSKGKDRIWDNTKYGYIYPKKELIISGGSINTPQLMMLSGIGDRNELLQKGIKPKVHLPGIGKNMQDRYCTALNVRFETPFVALKECDFRIGDGCYQNLVKNGKGGYTFNGLIAADIFKSNPNFNQSDVFTIMGPIYFTGYKIGEAVENLRKYKNMFTYYIIKSHTKNTKGVVKLKTTDPRDPADVNFNYFAENANEDLDPLVMAIRKYRKLSASFPHKLIEVNPGIERQSDDDIKEYIRRTAWGHHACCTMKIGEESDKMAVLDGNFRVRKIKNLRVVDMSIFSKIPGYFPVMFLYMIGAKASDAIAADYPLN